MNATQQRVRKWLIRWLYAAALAHFLVGVLLQWCMDAPLLSRYHQQIELAFWHGAAPAPARAQQLWWIALFGATVQTVGLWMAALVHLGARYRSTFAWGMLSLGIVIWAPQDMFISMQASAWIHVGIDLIAVGSLLPPLLWLWWQDRAST